MEEYTRSMETIYLRAQVAVGTFFMKSPVPDIDEIRLFDPAQRYHTMYASKRVRISWLCTEG